MKITDSFPAGRDTLICLSAGIQGGSGGR